MRKVFLGLGLVVGLLLVAAFCLRLFLNRIIDANRERILQNVSAAAGRTVTASRIRGSLRGGIGVRLDDVRVEDSPGFGSEPFLAADSAMAHVAIAPLLRGELQMGRIDIEKPRLSLVHASDGRWNYETLAPRKDNKPQAETAPGAQAAPIALSIAAGNIANGSLTITDFTSNPTRTIHVGGVNLSVGDVSTTTPIRFALVAAVETDEPNLRLTGQVGPLAEKPFTATMQGRVGPYAGFDLDRLDAEASVSPGNSVDVGRLAGKLFDGDLSVRGRYVFAADQVSSVAGSLRGFDLGPVVKLLAKATTYSVVGTADLDLSLEAYPARGLRETAAGNLKVSSHGIEVRDLNLVNEALGRFTGLPGMAPLLTDKLKGKYKRLLAAKDTHIDQVTCSARLADQRVNIQDLSIEAPDFAVQTTGTLTLDGAVDLAITVRLSQQLSDDIAADVKEARYLQTPERRIELPMRWRGRLPKDKPQPDMERLGALVGGELGQKAGKAIEKLLGGSDQGESPIERGLRKLFGSK